jgi:hypothetical protein
MSADPEVEKARLEVVATARFMLAGTLSFIEGARQIIGRQREADLDDRDADIVPFVAIASETDAYPFGETRLLWKPESLARLQPEIDRAEQWAREVGEAHCLNLIERLSPASEGALLTEAEFWPRLARRINAELRAARDQTIRFLWLDDFIPDTLWPAPEQGKMLVLAFVSEDDGKSFVEYRVCLHLGPAAVERYRKRDWSGLLPQSDAAGWCTIDRASRTIDVICR